MIDLKSFRGVFVLFILSFTIFTGTGLGFADTDAIEDDILELINRERRRLRLAELDSDDKLAKVARRYSRQMARTGDFGHVDRSGSSVVDRITDAGLLNYRKIGENLFYCKGYDDAARESVRGWLRSPAHRRNMLDSTYSLTGIGVAEARDGGIYVTQIFMRP